MQQTDSAVPAGSSASAMHTHSNPGLIASNPESQLDLIGGSWAVIESDPGVFTTLMQRLGIARCEAQEIYSVGQNGLSHLGHIHGFLFCSTYAGLHFTAGQASVDPESDVWFANQLINDACATQAILNILLNCPDVNVGDKLRRFRDFTKGMSSTMKGLAVSNDPDLRDIQNSLARPADLRESISTAVRNTPITEAEKKRSKGASARSKSPMKRKRNTRSWSTKPRKGKKKAVEGAAADDTDEFHFVGYVPFGGKVWELDGLRSAPIEVGDVPAHSSWLDVVRPAIQMKMHQIQQQGEDIRFNLMAIVEGMWEKRSDEIEMLRREKTTLERRLDAECEGWKTKLEDAELLQQAAILEDPSTFNKPFDPAFGFQKQQKQMVILNLPADQFQDTWVRVVRDAKDKRLLLDEETEKAQRWRSENIKRSFDYEPFIREFICALSDEGLLAPLLGYDDPVMNAGEEEDIGKGARGRTKKSRV
ncbi:hypothetical protein FRB93_013800 [Tulasnella sp. JGI-2019a]|nr:hypothetical protein FRB93_013800 [Tulasnella sp. JGI-2019a]